MKEFRGAEGAAMMGERLTLLSLSRLRLAIEQFVPQPILRVCRNLIWTKIRQQYGQIPIAEAFTQTYRKKLWGRIKGEEFFSGPGSLDKFSAPYVEWLVRFIADHHIGTVVDLGCGDFRIGRRICSVASVNYIGVDIVRDLIVYNQLHFEKENVCFKCANIIEDELPNGELCLIRQVFQHLSNEQISSIIDKCSKFPYVIVTEDVYSGRGMRPNLDIMHGPDNRIFKRSGVFLEQAPFNLQTRSVLEIPCPATASVIRTCLIENKNKPAACG
jgi:hypothetical protein